ncbi:MAG: sel1 repeat family protein [Hyphomonadaceae bacterium]|nr:sel1 repeat family protein [Hyphomonadaceae bacterium]
MRAANEPIVGVPAAQSAPAATPAYAPPPAAYDAYDPFHLANDDGDDAPFDAPSEAELNDLIDEAECLLLDERSAMSANVQVAAPEQPPKPPPRKAPMALEPLRPVISLGPRDRTYLYTARQAARNVERRVGGVGKVRFAARVTALTVLIGAGAMMISRMQFEFPAPSLPAPASAAAAAPVDPLTDYTVALARLDAGQTAAGLQLLRRAAEAGLAPAQYRLAKAYENGEGVERDLTRARDLTERAAAGGNCRAMHDAGVFLARGEGAPMDEAEAARWFRAAAERGVADSQYNLGILHQQGRGVTQSAADALYWFLVAARRNDINAVERAVEVATQLTPEQVAEARSRARAFRAQPADAQANGAVSDGASFTCATS